MNDSISSVTPRAVAPWVVPVVEELGALADLTLQSGSTGPVDCDPDFPETCGP